MAAQQLAVVHGHSLAAGACLGQLWNPNEKPRTIRVLAHGVGGGSLQNLHEFLFRINECPRLHQVLAQPRSADAEDFGIAGPLTVFLNQKGCHAALGMLLRNLHKQRVAGLIASEVVSSIEHHPQTV